MNDVPLGSAPSAASAGRPSPAGREGFGSAHSKAILIGEHSVVYGAPAIAIPVESLVTRAWAVPRSEGVHIESELYTGANGHLEPVVGPVLAAINAALEEVGLAGTGVSMRVESSVPFARGLGSSAAVGAAIARAIGDMAGRELVGEELNAVVQAAEVVAHGKPSGLDARTVVSDTPIRFEKGAFCPVEVAGEFHFVIADTGASGSTAHAVSSIREQYDAERGRVEEAIGGLAKLVEGAIADFGAHDAASLGARMSAAHEILRGLQVSTPELDSLVAEALAGGALGAKLTGSGLGGCIISLTHSAESAEALRERLAAAGAADTWHTKVEPQ
ncbi:mevalonate kinase [Dietzia sp.]|uniref:mevalonate kinase n=1 Tax=Dietzia sp. TaxID=1871616 RepID=UPI002FDB52E9